MESVFYGFETLKFNIMITEENKNLDYWKKNAEEDYMQVPISVLRYISELEEAVKNCSIPAVVGRSEQLKAFADYAQKRVWEDGDKDLSEFVDEFLRL